MRLALDTNRYVDLAKLLPDAVQTVQGAAEVFLPFAVLAELRAGFLSGSRRQANEQALAKFLVKPGVRALYPDDQTTSTYAALHADLRRRGRAIPHNDLWIAALCVQHGLTLYTRDGHFDHLPQVPRI